MHSTSRLTNCLMVQAICRKVIVTKRGTTMTLLRRSIHLTGQKELTVTKEQVDAFLNWLDKPSGGMSDAVRNLQSARSDALLASVVSIPLHSNPIEFSLVPWNKSKTSSETYLVASRMRVTWNGVIPKLCLKSWMGFEALSMTAR